MEDRKFIKNFEAFVDVSVIVMLLTYKFNLISVHHMLISLYLFYSFTLMKLRLKGL